MTHSARQTAWQSPTSGSSKLISKQGVHVRTRKLLWSVRPRPRQSEAGGVSAAKPKTCVAKYWLSMTKMAIIAPEGDRCATHSSERLEPAVHRTRRFVVPTIDLRQPVWRHRVTQVRVAIKQPTRASPGGWVHGKNFSSSGAAA